MQPVRQVPTVRVVKDTKGRPTAVPGGVELEEESE